MKISDIVALAKAGYNAEQINGMYKLSKEENENTSVTVNLPKENIPQSVPTSDKAMDSLLAQMQSLTQTIQKGFIAGAQQPEHQITLDDITAQIIAPPKNDTEV